jgi:hypothetical protein
MSSEILLIKKEEIMSVQQKKHVALITLAVATLMLTLPVASADVVANWKFENTLTDAISTSNLTASGGAFVADVPSNNVGVDTAARDFQNNTHTAGSDLTFDRALDFTFETFVKLKSTGDTEYIASFTGEGDALEPRVNWSVIKNPDDTLTFRFRNDVNTLTRMTGSTVLQADQWYHIAAVYAGNGASEGILELFLNGVSEGAVTGVGLTTGSASGSVTLGTFNLADFLSSEVRISDAVLSPGQFMIPEPASVSLLIIGGACTSLVRLKQRYL